MRTVLKNLSLGIVFALGVLAPSAVADGEPADRTGTIARGGDGDAPGRHQYLVYTPRSVSQASRGTVPLVVVVHGCQTTARQQMAATRYNDIADREGFVVLYPDVDQSSRALPGPLHNCWRFFDSDSWHRGRGEAGAIARMTREVLRRPGIDPRRVYLAGMSAGGFMTSALAATDPDLYAAVAIASAGAYADPGCLSVNPATRPVDELARLAYIEMGHRARIVPRLVIGGDRDDGIPSRCHEKALRQGLLTNDLVARRFGSPPMPTVASAVRHHRAPHGYRSTVRDYRYGDCLVAQRWTVHGMGHYWSGGSPDPRWSRWTDPKGPDAAEISWQFFNTRTRTCRTR
ncbi:putative esterase [Gordonia araii NBRC 100433]|uniref:Putative esterase n=1 Tax=Gordonia araii NBRC 100433 TaxID=1073574 RepID=G7H1F5_9ACTN|nr:PHB depolymerase family esterase [Gordonia araii]NNG97811.1 PHB depolymerase family esterase [Gordonia araii NBRC 100433]GAB09680.1 putative esterase [Gordonia araii NBRC 100433]